MNSQTIIATVERIIRLERGLAAKKQAAILAKTELEASTIGTTKRQLSRQKAREADAALSTQETELAHLRSSIPPSDTIPLAYSYKRVAEYRVDRSSLERQETETEAEIEAEKGRQKTQKWKWQGRKDAPPEPKEITVLRKRIDTIRERIVALDASITETMDIIAADDKARLEDTEVDAWAANGYKGSRPTAIQRNEDEFREEMAAGCVSLPLRKAPMKMLNVPVPNEEDDWAGCVEWGQPLSVAAILEVLMPTPVAIVVDDSYVSTGRVPAAIQRLLDAKKQHRLRMAAAV